MCADNRRVANQRGGRRMQRAIEKGVAVAMGSSFVKGRELLQKREEFGVEDRLCVNREARKEGS